MSFEADKRYSFEQAEAEAAKMLDLAGEKADRGDYDAAEFLLDEERAAQEAAAAGHPASREGERAEAAETEVKKVETELVEKSAELGPQIIGQPRIRKEYPALLPRHTMPTASKRREMDASGLKVKSWLFFPGSDREPIEVNEEIGKVVQKGYEIIRRKFPEAVSKEQHYQKLDRTLGQLAARHRPDIFGLDSPDINTLARTSPEVFQTIKDTPCELRFGIVVKETELPPLSPRPRVVQELPPVLPTAEMLGDEVDELLSLEDAKEVDFSKLQKPDAEEERLRAMPPGEKVADRARAAQGRIGHPASELRLLSGRLANAHRTGEWDDQLVDDYIRLMDGLPQYIQHRLAYLDLILRAEKGEIKMPETMISVASGPHNAARAQHDLDNWAREAGVKAPWLMNVDLSDRMLSEGSRAFAEVFGVPPSSADVRGSAFVLPVKDGAFDMSECSSLDSFSEPADVYLALSEMVRVTRPKGLVNIAVRRELPDAFYGAIRRDLGLDLLTPPHSQFVIPDSLVEQMRRDHGQKFADKMKRKSKHAEYILATRSDRPAKLLDKERSSAIFAEVQKERRNDPAMDQLAFTSSLHEQLRRLARETVNAADFAINKAEDRAFAAPPAPEPMPAEKAPEPARDVAVEVEPKPSERFQQETIRKLESYGWDERRPEHIVERQAIVRELVRTIKAEVARNAWPSPESSEMPKEEAAIEQARRETAARPLAAIRMLPRAVRVKLLKDYAPKVAADLYRRGIFRPADMK